MRSRRPRSIRSTLVAIVLSIAATAMVFQSVAAIGILEVLTEPQ
jgi:hypothetical protein